MLKRRGLLIGLGLGLMIGASVLQLILAAEQGSSSLSLTGSSLTQEELQREAKAQGYSLVESTMKTYTQAELDAAVQQAADKALASVDSDNQAGAQTDASKSGAEGSEPSSSPASPSPSESSPEAAAQEERSYSFYIRTNASLIEVATALHEMGLIEDTDQFVRQAKPYSKNLRVGTSQFTGNPTFDEIIAEITRAKY